jgi:hypothetical protein
MHISVAKNIWPMILRHLNNVYSGINLWAEARKGVVKRVAAASMRSVENGSYLNSKEVCHFHGTSRVHHRVHKARR